MKVLVPFSLLLAKIAAESISKGTLISVFYDDFNGEAGGSDTNHLLDKWNIISGAVDLCGPGTSYEKFEICVTGKCIDLVGSKNFGSIKEVTNVNMETKASFYSEASRSCKLSYMLAGSQRGDTTNANTATVGVVDANDATTVYTSKDTVLTSSAGYSLYEQTFTVPAKKSIKVSVKHDLLAPDNQGLLLDNVKLECSVGEELQLFKVFEENFEQDVEKTGNAAQSLKKWGIITGSVDLKGPTAGSGGVCPEGSAKCVGLGKSVKIASKSSFSATCPRVCKLSYTLGGANTGTGSDTSVISAVTSSSIALSGLATTQIWNAPFQTFSQVFSVPGGQTFNIQVDGTGNDNYGQILDNLNLCCTRPSYHKIFYDNFANLDKWQSGGTVSGNILKLGTGASTTQTTFKSSQERCCKLSYKAKATGNDASSLIKAISGTQTLTNNAVLVDEIGEWSNYEVEFTVPASQGFQLTTDRTQCNTDEIKDVGVFCTADNDGTTTSVEQPNDYELLVMENFDNLGGTTIRNTASGTALGQFKVVAGSIDIVGRNADNSGWRVDFPCYKNSGKCIDLDGSTFEAGTLETISTFASDTVRTCRLRYALSGSKRPEKKDTVTVSAVGVETGAKYFETVHTMNWNEGWKLSDSTFEVPAGKSFFLRFAAHASSTLVSGQVQSDNIGLLLDDVTLQCRPKYESCSINTNGGINVFDFELALCFNNNDMIQIIQWVNEFTQKIYYSFNQKSVVHFTVPKDCNVCAKTASSMFLQSEAGDLPQYSCSSESSSELLQDPSTTTTRFILCNSDASCKELKQQAANPRANVINISETNEREAMESNVFKPSNFIQPYLCPNTKNAVAVPYYEDCSNTMKCRCQCPIGYETKIDSITGKLSCSKKEESCKECKWLDTCYLFIQSDAQVEKCTIKAADRAYVPDIVPFPNDNYVGGIENPVVTDQTITGPRIVLEMLDGNKVLKSKIFSWKEFGLNRVKLVQDFAEYNKVGKYTLQLTAYDYSNEPAKCSTIVSIKDGYHPQPANTNMPCPGSVGNNACSLKSYDASTYSKGHQEVDQFFAWVNNLKNDNCGNHDDCSTQEFKGDNFGTSPRSMVHLPEIKTESKVKACLDITETDVNAMAKFQPNVKDEFPYKADFCKKCCQLVHTAQEKIKWWECGKKDWSEEECVGTPSGKCTFKGCFSAKADDFFAYGANIDADIVKKTKSIIDKNFPNEKYMENSQVHQLLNCEKLDENCKFVESLGKLFQTTSNIKSDWAKPFANHQSSEFVHFRYRVNKGDWNAWDATKAIEFKDLITCIDIEAYSACGAIGNQKTFFVYLHPLKTLDVCYTLERLGWSQVTTGNIEGEFCNVPHSNFAEFTFEFDTKKHNFTSFGHFLGYEFSHIECDVAYKKSDGSLYKETRVIPKTQHSVLEHFGVEYISNPRSVQNTAIKMTCDLYFRHDASTDLVKKSCSKELTFKDCDKPNWDCPYGDCISTCATKRPFQQCGGNAIKLADTGTVFTSKYFNDQQCCTNCDASISCSPLLDGAVQLKQCQPTKLAVNSLIAIPQVIQEHASVLLGLMGVMATVVVAMLAKKQQAVTSMDYTLVHDDV